MEVFDAVRTVLATRAYKPDPVPPETIRRIVAAAHLTASSMNGQPWRFIVVSDRAVLQQIGKLSRTGAYIVQAPLAVAVAIEKTKYAVSDASRAIQSMILTAWADGIASNWVGFFGLDEIKPVLGIPQELDLLAIVPFGYPLEKKMAGRKKRKPLGEVVHSGKFGQPFS